MLPEVSLPGSRHGHAADTRHGLYTVTPAGGRMETHICSRYLHSVYLHFENKTKKICLFFLFFVVAPYSHSAMQIHNPDVDLKGKNKWI